VFTDLNGDRNRQEGEPLRKHAGAVEFLDINSSRSRSFLRFYPNGSAPGSNISIRFCDQRGAQFAGKIVVSNSGRIRMETGGIEATENCP
jgi:type IV fimbrial biogenesis protein FimT